MADANPQKAAPTMGAKVSGQGALLLSGFAIAQIFAFARNALIGHWLSQGDFGIAATITVTLQLIETLSDVGSDRLIVQADDGDDPALTALAHLTWVIRGLLTGAILYLLAGPLTSALGITHAQWAFEVASLVPVIKGFTHLDFRLAQRQLNNTPFVLYEIAPQIASSLIALPLLSIDPTYAAIPGIVLTGAITAVVLSHALSTRPYRIGWSKKHLSRTLAFGWPIWLSALPLVAVYQGDRFLIGALLGMEPLAAFTTAFMITMVPGLLAAKAGTSLMLPLLAQARHDTAEFAARYAIMSQATVVLASAYLIGFSLAGGAVLPIVFGENYTGLGPLVTCLAMMWALRMVQAVPGMALMAKAETKPLLVAGLIRALGLPLAYFAATSGFGLIGMAGAGLAAEAASLSYVAIRAGRGQTTLVPALIGPCLALLPAFGIASLGMMGHLSITSGTIAVPSAIAAAVIMGGLVTLTMPNLRALTWRRLQKKADSPYGASQAATGSIVNSAN